MTLRLFDTDAYLSAFSATVLRCEPEGDRFAVVLEATAFFPEMGGQTADNGTLGGARVLDVREAAGEIIHYTDRPLPVGSRVEGAIEFAERFEKMQCHTAEHIVSGIIHTLYGYDNVGFHLGRDSVTFDVSAPLSRDQLWEVERLANEAVYRNLPVTATYPDPLTLPTLTYRAKLDLTEGVRIVTIGDVDVCACCAPHVSHTGEIGHIRLYEFEKHKEGVRIRLLAGRRALLEDRRTFLENYRVATSLSVKQHETAETVEKLRSELAHTAYLLRESEMRRLRERAESITPTARNMVFDLADAPVDAVRAFSNALTPRVEGVLVLLYGEGEAKKVILSSDTVDLRAALPTLRDALSLRGGGSARMVQGSVGATLDAIERYFAANSLL